MEMDRKFWVLLCVALMVSRGAAVAGEGFETSLSLGVTLTDGNSETVLGNATLLTEGRKEHLGSLRAGVEGNYGESTVRANDENGQPQRRKTETHAENLRGFANARKTISERTFFYLDGSALYDGVAEIDYRYIIGPGLGAYLLKRDRTSLSVEVGPSYVWEKVADNRDHYLALRVAQRFDHAFSETARLWQSAEYLPKADAFGDYLLRAELGAEADLNARLGLRLVLQNQYDSEPGRDLKSNDLTLIAGARVAL